MALKDSYLALITSQHKNKPRYMAMVEALLHPFDGIFEAATYFDDAFDLDLAAGVQQELLGDIVGQPRALGFVYSKDGASVLDDTSYRLVLKAKIIRNLWTGEIADLHDKWRTLFGAPIRIADNQDMTMTVLLEIDETEEMQKLMRLTAHDIIVPKPMGVRLNYKFYYPEIHLPVTIRQIAKIMQIADARHIVWNQGTARTVRWDSTFRFDKTIRFNGIYGTNYRDRQHHTVEIWLMVNAVQYNLVPVNVWNSSFRFDGSHTWHGSSMERLPLHQSTSSGKVEAQHRRAAKLSNRIAAVNCPDVYLANPSDHTSSNLQVVISPQSINPRQISDGEQAVAAPHRQQWSFGIDLDAQIKSPQRMIIKNNAAATERVVATQNTDYRTSNLFDGSFRFDGTHTFSGQKLQNYAQAAHCCSITRMTKNGLGRMETT